MGRWEDLARTELIEALTLAVSVRGIGKRVTLPREVHSEDGRLFFRDEEALGDPQLGGRAVAGFFPRESREMVAYAWSHAWRRAEMAGHPAEVLQLAAPVEADRHRVAGVGDRIGLPGQAPGGLPNLGGGLGNLPEGLSENLAEQLSKMPSGLNFPPQGPQGVQDLPRV